MRLFRVLFALALCLPLTVFAQKKGELSLAALGQLLTEPNNVYGRPVTAEELGQRVVVIWNISSFVEPGYNRLKAAETGDDDDNNRRWNNNRDDKDKEGGPQDRIREESRAIQRASKGAVKDGRLLVIAVDPQPKDPELRRFRTQAIRELKPYFPVYDIDAEGQYFDCTGKFRGTIPNIVAFAQDGRLTAVLEETPPYIPGRIITFKTEKHEMDSARLVVGKNIESVLKKLRAEANGSGDRAEEAKRMVEAVETWIATQTADIESDLQSAPSRALMRIESLARTVPSVGNRFAGPRNALRAAQPVKKLTAVRIFLKKANHGDIGRGDIGRQADGFIRDLEALSQGTNKSVAAEASTLLSDLQSFSSATLEAEQDALHGAMAERRKARDEARKERERENRLRRAGRKVPSKDDEDAPSLKRVSVGSVLAKSAGDATIAPLRAELDRLDDATCNYEQLRATYAGLAAKESGERTVAAKAVVDAITGNAAAYQTELAAIVSGKPLDLFSDASRDWEQILTVNYPTLQRTPAGAEALKMLRDRELRTIYGLYDDAINGEPDADVKEGENRAITKNRYQQTKLKSLQRTLTSNTKYGRLAAAQLAARGYTVNDIQKKVNDLEDSLKELKRSQKEAEKAREKAQKEARRNRKD